MSLLRPSSPSCGSPSTKPPPAPAPPPVALAPAAPRPSAPATAQERAAEAKAALLEIDVRERAGELVPVADVSGRLHQILAELVKENEVVTGELVLAGGEALAAEIRRIMAGSLDRFRERFVETFA